MTRRVADAAGSRRSDPRTTWLVEAGTPCGDLRGIELVGDDAAGADHDSIVAIALATSTCHSGPGYDTGRGFIEAQAYKRIGVVLDVERVVSWDHRKLGGAY